jgi:putative membrane protein
MLKGETMKTYRNYLVCLSRVAKTAAALGAAVFAATALQAQSAGQNATPPPSGSIEPSANVSHRAKEFLKEAAQANQTEIAMANVAEGKSQNTQVKDLARMLRSDHEQNYAQLQSTAQAHGITLDASLDMLNQHEVNRLQKANDAEFDKEYTKVMLKDHVKCIMRFDKAASDIEEQDVKQYAQNTLPALRRHLRKSEEAARSAGVDDSTISSILKELPAEDRAVTSR